VPQKDKERGQK